MDTETVLTRRLPKVPVLLLAATRSTGSPSQDVRPPWGDLGMARLSVAPQRGGTTLRDGPH
jgi:hypothetical protein